MKTVCKKLLCLMLVAMMLVSAIPCAFAAETVQVQVIYEAADGSETYDDGAVYTTNTTIEGIVNAFDAAWTELYNVKKYHVRNPQGTDVIGYDNDTVDLTGADMVWVRLIEKAAGEQTPPATEPPVTEPPVTEPPVTEPAAAKTTVYFENNMADKIYTREFANKEEVDDLPAGVNVRGYDFKGWYSEKNGKGDKLSNGDTWYDGKADTYYAYYVESIDDGVSTLSVYVRFYVAGKQQGNTQLLYTHEFEDGDNMFDWLKNHETKTSNAIFALDNADGYEWEPRYYYDYSGNEPLSEQDLIADGNKSVVVKVYSKKATEANVMLYVHKKASSTISAIYEMPGYTAGNTVTYADVKAELKEHYSSFTMTGLYDDEAWEQLLDGENPTAANGIKVEHNGTTKIHVILKNATSSTADSSNPKTGDYITVAATTMVLAAAALVSIIELKKRQMI